MKLKNSLILFLTAFIWGTAFVAQSVGMDYVGPFTFTCVRSILGGVVLLPCMAVLKRINPPKDVRVSEGNRSTLLLGGVCCGIALCVGSNLQQIGIMSTAVGKSGFITAFYIILVPVLGLFFGKRCKLTVWIGVLLAIAGLYFLCVTGDITAIERGDIMLFFCALTFSVHILVIDHFSPMVDGVKMSCIQFFVCGILSAIPMLLFEHPQTHQILNAWMPILYAGVLSCGVGYTLQIIGQKGMNPTIASLILSLESVISVLAGMVVLHQQLTGREILGCVLMFAAILMAQLP
ncbi:MAG: DMT family transporter [Eubacteriales bacterium]|nr:DMT family transporter [Eubacteriales bacterium]